MNKSWACCLGWRRVRAGVAAMLVLGLANGPGLEAGAQTGKAGAGQSAAAQTQVFDAAADEALEVMRRRAGELKITGVAVVAYFEGERIEGWESRMAVVGRLKDEPTATGKGSNLLAIAYAKAAEMADTLKDSGSGVRAPLTGEFGWSGGVIARGKKGYLIAAFSGGKSEEDVKVSQAGVEAMKGRL